MSDSELLLEVKNLTVRFSVKRGRWFSRKSYLYAVDDISFTVNRGKTLAIVGESGSGKTTAALAVARLVEASDGIVNFSGQDFLSLAGEALRKARTQVQFIFQDPYSSLNPRLRAEAVVREPLDSLTTLTEKEKQETIDRLFDEVGLHKEQRKLFPHQFSGGQRQRIGIARALSTRPELIICDEPVSALDVAVQAQVLNLLRELQDNSGLTYLFISHDLGVVQHMCDSVAVMYMGKIVEYGDRLSVFNNPQHPYTEALLSAVPSVDKTRRQKTQRINIDGDSHDPANPPDGCRFSNRCPKAIDRCTVTQPVLKKLSTSHEVACHLVEMPLTS